MGNTDTKLNFRKAIVQLTNKNQVREARDGLETCFQAENINRFLISAFAIDSSLQNFPFSAADQG